MKKAVLAGILFTIVVGGAAAGTWFTFGKPWWAVRQLAAASEDTWWQRVDAFASLGASARSPLVAKLSDADEPLCVRIQAALDQIGDPSTTLEQLEQCFDRMNEPGKLTALDFATCCSNHPSGVPLEAVSLMTRGIADDAEGVRVRAVALASRLGSRNQSAIKPLLNDRCVAVRQAALLTLATERDVVTDDELLRLLHDLSPEMRSLCESALVSRGLTAGQIRLGRMLADPRPAVRLDLIALLFTQQDVDAATWLTRMTTDPSPAVRAAVVRAAAEHGIVGMDGRLSELAKSDPDATVRANAEFYLKQSKIKQATYTTPAE